MRGLVSGADTLLWGVPYVMKASNNHRTDQGAVSLSCGQEASCSN
jgi:hypothetical protein